MIMMKKIILAFSIPNENVSDQFSKIDYLVIMKLENFTLWIFTLHYYSNWLIFSIEQKCFQLTMNLSLFIQNIIIEKAFIFYFKYLGKLYIFLILYIPLYNVNFDKSKLNLNSYTTVRTKLRCTQNLLFLENKMNPKFIWFTSLILWVNRTFYHQL